MSATRLHDLFAVLALLAISFAILLVLARLIPAVASVRFLDLVWKINLPFAAIIASTATLGSLYWSEVYEPHWIPCRFCWFQRIFMYSTAVILVIAAIRRDRGIKWYAGPLAAIGIALSTWHHLIERRIIEESATCAASGTSCAAPYDVSFGSMKYNINGNFVVTGLPITLAVMAFCAFAAILALLFLPEPLEADALDTSANPPDSPPDTHTQE